MAGLLCDAADDESLNIGHPSSSIILVPFIDQLGGHRKSVRTRQTAPLYCQLA